MNQLITRKFDNGRIDGEIIFINGSATVVYNEDETYWGAKFFLLPWRKTRRVTKRITGNGSTWTSLVDSRRMDDDMDDDVLTFLLNAFEECEHEAHQWYGDADAETHFVNMVCDDGDDDDDDVIESIVVENTVDAVLAFQPSDHYEPEATHYEPVHEQPIYEASPAPEPTQTYSAPEPSYDSGDSGGYDSGDD